MDVYVVNDLQFKRCLNELKSTTISTYKEALSLAPQLRPDVVQEAPSAPCSLTKTKQITQQHYFLRVVEVCSAKQLLGLYFS